MHISWFTSGQKVIVRGESSLGLTARGRVMKFPWKQQLSGVGLRTYFNVYLQHIRGPLEGSIIFFPSVTFRIAKDQNVCSCDAYSFPHAKGKGKCPNK